MAGLSMNAAYDETIGRLPTPIVDWPVSEERFRQIAERWRTWGVWVSLWNREGEMVACDQQAGRLWDALRAGPNPFCLRLTQLAIAAMETKKSAESEGEDYASNFGPWQPDLGLIAIPVRSGRRSVGAILGAVVMTDRPDEAFARLCNQCELDLNAMTSFLNDVEIVPAEKISNLASTLSFTVQQARAIEVGSGEISILTHNLENTYEELHLIYEISRQMGIPQKPIAMLEKVGREMLEVSRAAGLAFVVTNHASTGTGNNDGHEPAFEERAVQVGQAAPSLNELERLTHNVCVDDDQGTGYLLLNQAGRLPEFRWASNWLKHLLVLPLRHEHHELGVFYAMNCKDNGDYTSADVQLLRAVADRVTAALQNQHLYDDLSDLLMGLLHALVKSVDAKDPYTFGHSERVAYFSRVLSSAIGMSPIDCERVYLAGLLHDVGKIGVPDAILCKPGKLTKQEFDALKKHPEIGERILAQVRQIRDLIPGVLYHHERMDGCGYPHRLAGRDIPLLGRIICLADSFDAMTTSRTYRAAMPVSMAVTEIRRCSGNQFDPGLAEVFLNIDPARMFKEAHDYTGGDMNIGRIGALCAALSGYSSSQKSLSSSHETEH
ncbi:MAG: HD domain-containing protein [Phycisphaerales bacterium]|nr:HD domain-containing protein [Phycisphaerales bacterium]